MHIKINSKTKIGDDPVTEVFPDLFVYMRLSYAFFSLRYFTAAIAATAPSAAAVTS